MKLLEAMRMALHSLFGHKVRTSLTLLGVVIGIASVVTLVSFGTSLKLSVVDTLGTAGGRSLSVNVASGDDPRTFPETGAAMRVFSERDTENLAALPHIESASPVVSLSATQVERNGTMVLMQRMLGTGPGHPFLRDRLDDGRTFDPDEREAVVGAAVRTESGDAVRVGDLLTFHLSRDRTYDVLVVGRLAPTRGLDPLGMDNNLYLPVDPFYQSARTSPITGERTRVFSELTLVASTPDGVGQAKEEALAYLRSGAADAHHFMPNGHQVRVLTEEEFAQAVSSVFDQVTLFVAGIAVVSLVVGSIGIANIMLVSVTERRRTIGVMKAIGARDSHILRIFLVEAALLGVVGGILGLLLGVFGAWSLTHLVLGGTNPQYPLGWLVAAVFVGGTVGILSGLVPAWRAARVDPVKALGHD